MKRMIGFIMLAGLLALAGCVSTPEPGIGLAAVPPAAVKTYPPVTHDQIIATNPHQGAQMLMEEMDREAQQNLLTTSPR